MMESVYLETTFISYLVARPSRDLLIAGHQQITQDWWANRRLAFDCFVSPVVFQEASAGEASEIQKRLAIINTLMNLEVTDDAESLTEAIISSGVLPGSAARWGSYCLGLGSRDRLPTDLELQALGEWPNHAKNSINLSTIGSPDADHLYA